MILGSSANRITDAPRLYVWGPLSRTWMPVVLLDLDTYESERAEYRENGICTCWVKDAQP